MTPELNAYLRAMPKVELHVHLEGAIEPATVLALANKNGVKLPADTVEGLRDWFRFTDFDHFVEIYLTISSCLTSFEDIETIAREFLAGQAKQNVRHTEFTYTAWNHYARAEWSFDDQLAALNAARHWAAKELDISSGIVIDIPRIVSPEEGVMVADWAISGMGNGVVGLGLGGPEVGNPAERYVEAFDRAWDAGLPAVPHAGETVGPESVWAALRSLRAQRIGHGVRSIDDRYLVEELVRRRVPLEVCPTSNLRVGGVASLAEHPLPRLMHEGVFVTLNSDDPALFNSTLTEEYLVCADAFGLEAEDFERLALNGAEASLLTPAKRVALADDIRRDCAKMRAEFSIAAKE